jgi:hypothetical protein
MLIIVANVSALLIYFGCIVQQLRKRIPLGTGKQPHTRTLTSNRITWPWS